MLGILLVTSEWGQRTGMVTFTLEPHRGKVIAAKVVAALVLGLLAVVARRRARGAGHARRAVRRTRGTNIGIDDFAKFALLQVSGVLRASPSA